MGIACKQKKGEQHSVARVKAVEVYRITLITDSRCLRRYGDACVPIAVFSGAFV
jgi:hypothetical protein